MAEIIQFVPKPKPGRHTLLADAEAKAEAFLNATPSLRATDGVYVAPDTDCA
jgi:hypothetical protein